MDKKTGSLAGRRAAFLTLGCKVNSYETEAMQALLRKAQVQIVEFEETADLYIVNTCSVTNMADRKSRQMLHRAKKRNPEAIVVAAGCYVQTAEEAVLRELDVDVLIGNNQKKDIVAILEEHLAGRENHRLELSGEQEYEEMKLDTELSHTRAYIKIQDGCNQFCSYCIIPYARGRIRSRDSEEILKEARRLAAAGYQEIVLTGIHLSSYGQPAKEGSEPLLALVLQLNEVEKIQRIRLGSLEPRIMTEHFVKTLSSCSKVCPQFHLSLQSGSDSVLRRMNRKYTTKEYEQSVLLLRTWFENPAITTDIIVGFPQETEEEFLETMEFARKIGFAKIHVFSYSRRKGTVADRMTGQIPEEVKHRRSEQLLALERELAGKYRCSFLGKTERVLLEEETAVNGRRCQTGYNERYVRMAVETEEPMSNRIATVRVREDLTEQETLLCDFTFE